MTKDNTQTVRQFTVGTDDNDIRLDRWFKRHLPQVGFATISRWARTGQIRVDGKRVAPEDHVLRGQLIRVPPGDTHVKGPVGPRGSKPRVELTDKQLELADSIVIHRDPAAIVINKPPGLATQGGTGTHEHVDGLLDAYAPDGPRPRLVHRLDKDTSGALLVAATPGSAAFFSRRFASREATKIYWALCVGVPSIDEGLIDLPLAKQPGSGGEKMMVDKSEQGQAARSRYRVIDRAGNSACWVELQPFTGRTHQLRVHMAAIGHPIVGDGKYGGPEAFLTGTISRKMHLHARRIIIPHPDGTPLDIEAELPDHFAASLAQLGFDEDDGEFTPDTSNDLTKEDHKSIAKAHAKQYRKERRGERRGRAENGRSRNDASPTRAGKPAARPGGVRKGLGSPKPAAGAPRPAAGAPKPAAAGMPKPAGRPAAVGKPTSGKSTAGKAISTKPARAPAKPRSSGAPRGRR